MIGRIAAVVYGLFLVKGLFSDLISVAEGSSGMGALASDLAAMILFALILFPSNASVFFKLHGIAVIVS